MCHVIDFINICYLPRGIFHFVCVAMSDYVSFKRTPAELQALTHEKLSELYLKLYENFEKLAAACSTSVEAAEGYKSVGEVKFVESFAKQHIVALPVTRHSNSTWESLTSNGRDNLLNVSVRH